VIVGALGVMLVVQMAVIQPPLNALTDIVLAGGDPGSAPLHLICVVADVILLALLVAYPPLSRTPYPGTAQAHPSR
jgi:hypothetical protein